MPVKPDPGGPARARTQEDLSRRDFLKNLESRLKTICGDSAKREAESLLRLALDTTDSFVLTGAQTLSPQQRAHAEDLAQQRISHRKPLSRIGGTRAFWKHTFRINARVLDPRPDTETLVEAALEYADRDRPLRLLDLGTGSGCILLSLLCELPRATGLGIDDSADALAVARSNTERIANASHTPLLAPPDDPRADNPRPDDPRPDDQSGLTNRVRWAVASWHDVSPEFVTSGPYDLVLCNPPYIDPEDKSWMAPEVLDHDPERALFAGPQGLADYRVLFPLLHRILTPKGIAVFEHGFDQRPALLALARESGLQVKDLFDDLSGNKRCIALQISRANKPRK